MPRNLKRIVLIGTAFIGVLFAPLAASAQTGDTPARFIANAIDMNRGAAGTVEFVVNRWSSQADYDRLLEVMFDKGPEQLLDTLQDMPRMGYIRRPGSIGWEIRFARRMPAPDGGERIMIITDRRMSFREVARRPRSFDYPFTVIEFTLPKEGKGEGNVTLATRITGDKRTRVMTLENFDIQPIMLTRITRERIS
jgi:hypothetical protein